MPELPARLAEVAVRMFARSSTVTHVEALAPKLRLIRVEGEDLRGVPFIAGQEIEVRVSDRAFRHYTPSYFDTKRGVIELVIYLNGRGPGSIWAEQIAIGDSVDVLGPGGRFRLDDHLGTHVFTGDESSIALFRVLTNAVRPAARVVGAIEVDPEIYACSDLSFGPAEKIVRNEGERGRVLIDWVQKNVIHLSRPVTIYSAGHAGTIRRLKRALDGARIRFRGRPYWDEARRGM
jgi:NADPH-dependent ferric siderophore reductase